MKWSALFVFVYVCTFQSIAAVIYNLTDDEYYRMPPLMSLDHYRRCLRQPGDVYCSAFFVYVSDGPSPLLHQMLEYSEHTPVHFNHTKAFYGVCMKKSCKHFNNNLADPRQVLEECLNSSIYEKYKLKLRIDSDVSCITTDEKIKIDTADWIVAVICMSIVVLNVIGTFIDANCAKETKESLVGNFFLCFSILRNWKRLVATSGEGQDPRIRRLKGIQGLRGISMILVIMAHSMLPAVLLGDDPQFYEEAYKNPILHIALNGTLIMQTFLIISSFLLIYNLQIIAEKHNITWTTLVLAFIKRWLRLTPSYALILAVTATWLRHLGSGPLWQYVVVSESNDCRHHWWRHFLFINNYFDGSYCMPQTWYLATDTQLYTLGLLIYMLSRDWVMRKKVITWLFIISLTIPALHTYFQDLDGALLITPTTVIDFFRSDRTFNLVYKRGHTNLAGYVIGIILGYLVYHLQNIQIDVTKYKKYRPVFWCMFPLGAAIILSCRVWYSGPRASLPARLLTAVVNKPLFATCVAAILLGLFFKIDNIYRGVCEWEGWTVASRASYSAYLLHLAFIRTWTGMHVAPLSSTYVRLSEIIITLIVLTYLGACVFFITVEAPLGEMAKLCLEPSRTNSDNKKEDKKIS